MLNDYIILPRSYGFSFAMPSDQEDSGILTIKSSRGLLQSSRQYDLSLSGGQEDSWVQGRGAWRFPKAEIDYWIHRQSQSGATDDETAGTGEQK